MILGNGFSLALARFLNAADLFCLDVLMPPVNTPLYYPHSATFEAPKKIWTAEPFPQLLMAWEEWLPRCPAGISDRERYLLFCADAAEKGHINTGKKNGEFNIRTGDLSYQLRYFLWCVFRYNCIMLQNPLFINMLCKWIWARVLKQLWSTYYLRIISFNYDCFVETALSAVRIPLSIYCDGMNQYYVNGEPFVAFDPNNCHVVKSHGAMAFETITTQRATIGRADHADRFNRAVQGRARTMERAARLARCPPSNATGANVGRDSPKRTRLADNEG